MKVLIMFHFINELNLIFSYGQRTRAQENFSGTKIIDFFYHFFIVRKRRNSIYNNRYLSWRKVWTGLQKL